MCGESILAKKKLKSELKREALIRMEEAARSVEDFNVVVGEWNHLDRNRERNVRRREIRRDADTLISNFENNLEEYKNVQQSKYAVNRNNHYTYGMIWPTPLTNPAWHEALFGDFLSMIFDSADDMWQLIEDWNVALPVKELTDKQADVLFLKEVRMSEAKHIACYRDKTERAVRKLYTATLDSIRKKVAPQIREQIKSGCNHLPPYKLRFLEWYDSSKGERK